MRGMTIGWIAERNAYKYPDDEAVVHQGPDGRLDAATHAEFNDRIDRVANGLSARGIRKGDTIGVYMQNNIETLETYLAAMKLGALPVPVNHRFKAAEVAYVLRDSGAELLVFDADAGDVVGEVHGEEGTPTEYLFVGEEPPAFADGFDSFRDRADADPVELVPDRLDDAMLMYTSGTTGRPKGCILTHENLLMQVTNGVIGSALQGEDVNADGRLLIVTPLFHIAALGGFLGTYFVSGTTVMMDEFLPGRMLEVIEAESITGTFVVPTMARALLGREDFEDYDLSALETVGIGAAPAGRELKRTIQDRFGADLSEAFGQTEMSPTTARLHPGDVLEKSDAVGHPVQNVLVKVLDPDTGEEVEQGEIGQICYKGPTRFAGYHGMPERTDEVIDEDGWFHSGDLVRQDEDGFVYFMGRSDDMIISGGENVYPAEIEEVLHEHDAVDEAAVVGVPDETWGERIKAAVVLEDDGALDARAVREYVGERLADYKKPREVVFLDDLPRNPTGKVLKADVETIEGTVLEVSES